MEAQSHHCRMGQGLFVGVTTVLFALLLGSSPESQPAPVTFTKDIAPILQRSCQRCHHPGGVAPMPLVTYEQVRPYVRAIKTQTAARRMPPWYIEKNVGIHKFLDDQSLSDAELARIATWVDSGAPQGNAADLPPAPVFAAQGTWTLGTPDLIVASPEKTMTKGAPDWWGSLGEVPSGLKEDRYVASSEIIEVNDVPSEGPGGGLGGRFLFHHAGVTFLDPDTGKAEREPTTSLPTHEIGRNADTFDPEIGWPIKAGTIFGFGVHLHANSTRDSKGHLLVGLRFHPKDYVPKYEVKFLAWGAVEMDVEGNTPNQVVEAFYVVPQPVKLLNFEPHMHAAGVRMCMEAILGPVRRMLNCAGYNHNWVRSYMYDPDSAPLLPKGTILHTIGYNDTTPTNRNVLDSRNWSGWGQRTVDNMFNNLVYGVLLTDAQFEAEVAHRKELIRRGKGEGIGCLTCGVEHVTSR